MAYVREEIDLKEFEAELRVLEQEDSEEVEPWVIIDFHVDTFKTFTPKELKELGARLITEARRIRREYTATGKKRKH